MKHWILACLFALTAATACASGGGKSAADDGAASQPASQPAE